MPQEILLRDIAEPLGEKFIGVDDSEGIYAQRGERLSQEANVLLEVNPHLANWVNSGQVIESRAISAALGTTLVDISNQERIQPHLKGLESIRPRLYAGKDGQGKKSTIKKHTDPGDGRYLAFVKGMCRDIGRDLKNTNGKNTKKIIQACWPWIVNKIAGNEDLREDLNSDEKVQEVAVKTFILYFSFEKQRIIHRTRMYNTDKEALN